MAPDSPGIDKYTQKIHLFSHIEINSRRTSVVKLVQNTAHFESYHSKLDNAVKQGIYL